MITGVIHWVNMFVFNVMIEPVITHLLERTDTLTLEVLEISGNKSLSHLPSVNNSKMDFIKEREADT